MSRKLSILSIGLLVLMLAGCASVDFRATTEDSLMTGDYVKVLITGSNEYDLIGELRDEFT